MLVPTAIMNREVPSFNFWTSRSSEEKRFFRNVCELCWTHEPGRRTTMTFIVTSLRDFRRQKSKSRPLSEHDTSEQDAKRRRVLPFETLQDFNSPVHAQGIDGDQSGQDRPLAYLSSSLERLFSYIDSKSEVRLM